MTMRKPTRERFKTFGDVFDAFTIRNLFVLASKGIFEEDTLSPISIGKESNVFSASGPKGKVVVKIHRLETRDFNRMQFYIKSDPRFIGMRGQGRKVVFAWARREYSNLMIAKEGGARASLPIAFLHNIIVMEHIGKDAPAPMLKDAYPRNPKSFYNEIMKNVKKFYKAGYVHGDLSAFNILNLGEKPVFIDLSHSTPSQNPIFNELLSRDVRIITAFFQKHGLKLSYEEALRKVKG